MNPKLIFTNTDLSRSAVVCYIEHGSRVPVSIDQTTLRIDACTAPEWIDRGIGRIESGHPPRRLRFGGDVGWRNEVECA